jgi:hypothetical protein
MRRAFSRDAGDAGDKDEKVLTMMNADERGEKRFNGS